MRRRGVVASDSDLTDLSESSEEKESMSFRPAGGEEAMLTNGKSVKTFEDVSCNGKEVVVYRHQELARESLEDDGEALSTTTKHVKSDRPAETKQKRKHDNTDGDVASRHTKAPRAMSPRYVTSPPRQGSLITDAYFATQQFDIGRAHHGNKKQDRSSRPCVQPALARDEIAVPFDAIYGLTKPRPPQQNGQNGHRNHRPAPYPVSFTTQSGPHGQPPQPQVIYHPFPTHGPNGPMTMMHVMPPNLPPVAARYIDANQKPKVIGGGRHKLVGYRMKPTQKASVPLATQMISEQRGSAAVDRERTSTRPQVTTTILDHAPMNVDRSPPMADTNTKRLAPLEIRPSSFWSAAANQGVKVSEVRTSLESSFSKDSAATLVGSLSDDLALKGTGEVGVERGTVVE